MERVLVLGPCGSGKSTVAAKLGPLLDLPVIHLDREYWQPGWTTPSEARWQSIVDELAARPRWVIDGNYADTLRPRLERADAVIILDIPRRVFFWRMLRRNLLNLGKTRPDMAPGCPERLDFGFWLFTWTYNRERMPRGEAMVQASGVPVIRLRSQREVDVWLARLSEIASGNAATGTTGS